MLIKIDKIIYLFKYFLATEKEKYSKLLSEMD